MAKVNLFKMIRNILLPSSGTNVSATGNVKSPLLSFEPQSNDSTLGYEGTVSPLYIPDEVVSNYSSVTPEFPSRNGVDNLDLTSADLANNPTYQSDIAYHSALDTVPVEPEYSEV